MLDALAKIERFHGGNKNSQSELILWCLYEMNGHQPIDAQAVSNAFEALHLPKPNITRLKDCFRRSRNVRKFGNGYAPTREFRDACDGLIQFEKELDQETFDTGSITLPPFVSEERQSDLARMVRVYGYLFLLENSMRGLIETVLTKHLGEQWWEQAANAEMKRKHASRVTNEESKKWAPTRSDFGPLYALDWPDLIKLMRKYPEQFTPSLGDINFLHRYEDAGSFRNVVAHNGVLRAQDDYELIRIYYQNWIDQISGA